MSAQEIENAITKLPNHEAAQLTSWIVNYDAQLWDKQIEDDLEAGSLDSVLDEVDREYGAGLAKPL